jgi:Domain of unknown function (DUF4177)
MIWEYKTAINALKSDVYDKTSQLEFNVTETDQFLNIMGQNNWELVNVNPIINDGATTHFAYFFKRLMTLSSSNLPDIGYDIDHNGIPGSQL